MEIVPNFFLLIVGAPRSGTSLMVDLMKVCGFDFGETIKPNKPWMGKRSPRNEHKLTTRGIVPKDFDFEKAFWRIERTKMNATKIPHTFAIWVPEFVRRYDRLKIIVTQRDMNTLVSSNLEFDWTNRRRIIEYTQDRIKDAQNLLDSDEYHTFPAPFEKVLSKDTEFLKCLLEYVEVQTPIEKLTCIIDPEVSRYTKLS